MQISEKATIDFINGQLQAQLLHVDAYKAFIRKQIKADYDQLKNMLIGIDSNDLENEVDFLDDALESLNDCGELLQQTILALTKATEGKPC